MFFEKIENRESTLQVAVTSLAIIEE